MKDRFRYLLGVLFWVSLIASVVIEGLIIVSIKTDPSRTMSTYLLGWHTFSMFIASVLSPFSYKGTLPIMIVASIVFSTYSWFWFPHGFQLTIQAWSAWTIVIGGISFLIIRGIRKGLEWIIMLIDFNEVLKEEGPQKQLSA